jgi:hypothetical protein
MGNTDLPEYQPIQQSDFDRLHEEFLAREAIKEKKMKYGKALKAPVIPFSYNNIMSDDDIITGSGKTGQIMEKLYAESLDEIIRERAGRPMSPADRVRVDVNGLAWDMTQKGALDNFWHKEKYINPQSGYANQEKLLAVGDNHKLAQVFTEQARFKDLNNSLARHKSGSKFKAFLTSKTARALNMDLMLGIEATTPR